ncbi:serine/threonine-protein kinase [Polyangium aurulentum]|uniref:serine/threonine-protein kinase n=1 Tax=Polyangium aurulentum TaxID=2567896 RepID=UPI0010AE0E23|nr:serine/threonine-protein kinase [Polyangium aurulentum]UQA55566.1 serine/threonine protein kinase [Polyangium aurulentum]
MLEAPPPGTVLVGKYRVEREIGCGGMGVVVEATHVALEQRVAIKLLHGPAASSPDVVTRFLREARVAAKLASEHVVRVTDVGQTETGAPYLVMELLVGHDLEGELRRRGRLPVAEAVDLVLEACEGVAHAHARGLVHRDLKPANLFLAQRSNRAPIVKVLDFGLSKEAPTGAGSITGNDAVFGTPQYMSPEQIQSTKNVDARSDQHALAMVLYELLAGEPPYVAETITQLIVVIATQPPPRVRALRPDVPAPLEEAIVRALAKRRTDRFADLAGLAWAIAPFGGPEAQSRAEAIRRALAPGGPVPTPRASEPSYAPTVDAITVPLVARGPAQTHTAITSSADVLETGRPSRKRAAIAAIIVAAFGAIALAVVFGASGDPSPTDADDTARAPAAAPAPAEAPPPSVVPASTSSAAQAATPAGESSHRKTTKTAPPPAGGSTRDPKKVFGEKRR